MAFVKRSVALRTQPMNHARVDEFIGEPRSALPGDEDASLPDADEEVGEEDADEDEEEV